MRLLKVCRAFVLQAKYFFVRFEKADSHIHLFQNERKNISPEERMLDKLLISALIEARSCERFKLLSEGLEDETMRTFYRGFMESEAGHYRLFISLAKKYFPEEKVKQRWNEFLEIEKNIIEGLEVRGDRMH